MMNVIKLNKWSGQNQTSWTVSHTYVLTQFCKRVKRVFGAEFVTPNVDIHLHLADCVWDFGPFHFFWFCSFEGCNGLLGKQPTNNRAIELQLIQQFLRDDTHLDLLNTSGSTQLAERFSDIIYEYAKKLQSTIWNCN